MKELMHSVRAQLIAGYVAALLLLGITALGAATGASSVSHDFVQALRTDDVLTDIILLRTKLVDDEETALRGYLLTHDASFLVPYTTARRLLPGLRARSARLGTAVPGLQPLLVSMRQRVLAWERWARQVLAHPPTGPSSARAAQQREGERLFNAYRVASARVLHYLQIDQEAQLHAGLSTVTTMNSVLAAIFGGALVLMALIGWTIVRMVTQPLDRLRLAAEAIGRGDFSKPVTTDGASEFRFLAQSMDEMRRQLHSQHAELERSNAELAQFASVVAHDLRSPLTSIAGFSQLLQEYYADHLDARATKCIAGIVNGAKSMQALIEGVLAYAQVGAQAPPPEPIDCAIVVERALANLHAAVEERGALVTCGALPTVMADATQLSQVFQNLIGNAIKYCRETPRIAIAATREGAEWLFCVRDNGIGMDAADAERIFDIFQRAHAAAEYPGTGIGLAICKKTIERHGGRIWAESCVGQGTTFKFTLPAREAPARDP
jgi:signal transduction histidine kinase